VFFLNNEVFQALTVIKGYIKHNCLEPGRFRIQTLSVPVNILESVLLFPFPCDDLTMSSCPGDRHILTKVLSPFDDSADKNPVVRSVVLKLLLKYR